MRLTKQGEYALRSLICLGVAHELGREVVPVSEIAATERMPLKFVERILASLRQGGYIAALRGKAGGYHLAQPANSIKMGDVVRRIDGRLAPIGCASEVAYEPCSCPDEAHCGLRMLMIDVRNAIAGILDRYTLADIVAVTLMKLRRDGVASPLAARKERATKVVPNERHADPRDGFLASLGELLPRTDPKKPNSNPVDAKARRRRVLRKPR